MSCAIQEGFAVRPDTSETAFETFAKEHGETIGVLTARAGLRLMLDFYRDVRAEGVAPLDADGDMLLFQWGTFDWGKGEHFEVEICRQFRDAVLQDDGAMSQLRLVFYFTPTEDLARLKHGERWCDQPKWLSELELFIAQNEAYQAVGTSTSESIELVHAQV
jgi:hypothetical protein